MLAASLFSACRDRRCGGLALGQASMAVLALAALQASGVAGLAGWSGPAATIDQVAVSRRLPEQRRQELPLG